MNVSGSLRRQTPSYRVWWVATYLPFAIFGGGGLFFFSEKTDQFFAWTIASPISAAAIGSMYIGGTAAVVLMGFERRWARVRSMVPAIWLFVTLILIATLLHIDEFHFDSDAQNLRVAAWLWLVIYIVEPVVIPLLYFVQRREKGIDPPTIKPLPLWFRASFGVVAAALFVLGILLFLFSNTAADVWPWPLAPLVARALGGWFLALSFLAALTLRENDRWRLLIPATLFGVMGAFQLIAILRFSNQIDFQNILAWVYLGVMAAGFILGADGIGKSMLAPKPVEEPATTAAESRQPA